MHQKSESPPLLFEKFPLSTLIWQAKSCKMKRKENLRRHYELTNPANFTNDLS